MNEHVFLERTNRTASLSSWIVTAMIDLYVAEQEGLQGYIRWTRELSPSAYQDDEEFSRRSNMWEWYFLQPHCDAIDDSSPIWVWEDTQEILHKHDVSKSILENLYKERLRFNAEVEAEAEDLVKKYSVDFSNTLGVACRGTDKHTEASTTPIERYFPAIDQLIREAPDLRIFTKPEEKGALAAMLDRYPQAFSMSEFFSAETGERQMMDRINPVRGYERGKQVVLLILFYSRCKYLFKNASNMTDVAGYLSHGEVRDIP